jgi:hypothetical protein
LPTEGLQLTVNSTNRIAIDVNVYKKISFQRGLHYECFSVLLHIRFCFLQQFHLCDQTPVVGLAALYSLGGGWTEGPLKPVSRKNDPDVNKGGEITVRPPRGWRETCVRNTHCVCQHTAHSQGKNTIIS